MAGRRGMSLDANGRAIRKPSSFPTQVDPRMLPMGRSRLSEIAERIRSRGLFGRRRGNPRIVELPEAIRADIEREPWRICPSHDQLQGVEGLSKTVSGTEMGEFPTPF